MARRWDVVVVGGGVIGLACAWRASQRGLRTCVLERHRSGAGSSWHAAGWLSSGEGGLSRRAADAWPAFAEELGAPYRRIGCRFVTPGGEEFSADDAEVDPRAVVDLLDARVARGEHAPVVDGVWDGERLAGVRTEGGDVHEAETVVVATGCWGAGWLPPEARPPVRPVKGQIVRLFGDVVTEHVVCSEEVYLVPRATGQLVVGATEEERGFDTTVTAGAVLGLLREAERLVPEVAGLELVEATAGLRPGSPDGLPLVGRGAVEGLVVATGHHRNGILLAPVTADAVAALCAGEEVAGWEAWAPDRFVAALR